jgi:hypothetical protein
MTAEPTGHAMWAPNPIKQRLAVDMLGVELRDGVMIAESVPSSPSEIRLPIRDITP